MGSRKRGPLEPDPLQARKRLRSPEKRSTNSGLLTEVKKDVDKKRPKVEKKSCRIKIENDAAVKKETILSSEQHLRWPTEFSSEASVCRFINRYPTSVESVSFSEDGTYFAVGREEGSVDIYESRTGKLLVSVPGSSNSSARGIILIGPPNAPITKYRLLVTGLHGVVSDWSLRTLSVVRSSPSFGGAVYSCAYSSPLRTLFLVCDDGSPRAFQIYRDCLENDEPADLRRVEVADQSSEDPILAQSRCSSHSSRSDRSSRSGRNDASSGTPNSVDKSQSPNGEQTPCLELNRTYARHDGQLLSVCLFEKQYLFAGTAQSTILRWDIETGAMTAKLAVTRKMQQSSKNPRLLENNLEETHVLALVAIPQHNAIVSADSLGGIALWDALTCTFLSTFSAHSGPVLCLAASSEGDAFYSGGADQRLGVFRFVDQALDAECALAERTTVHRHDIRAIAASPRTDMLVTGSADSSVAVHVDAASISPTVSQELPNRCSSLASAWVESDNHSGITMAVHRDRVDFWYLQAGELSSLGTSIAPPVANSSPSSEAPLCGTPVKILSFVLGEDRSSGARHHIRCACLLPGGGGVAISDDAGIRVFDVDLAELTVADNTPRRLRKIVASAMCVLNDESQPSKLLTGTVAKDGPNFLVLWDLATGKAIARSMPLPSAILRLKVTADAVHAAALCVGNTALVWRIDADGSFEEIDIAANSADDRLPVGALSFSPDGQFLLLASSCGQYFRIFALSEQRYLRVAELRPAYVFRDSKQGKQINLDDCSAKTLFNVPGVYAWSDVCWTSSADESLRKSKCEDPRRKLSDNDGANGADPVEDPVEEYRLNPELPLNTIVFVGKECAAVVRMQISIGRTGRDCSAAQTSDPFVGRKKHPFRTKLLKLGESTDILHAAILTEETDLKARRSIRLYAQNADPPLETPVLRRKKFGQ